MQIRSKSHPNHIYRCDNAAQRDHSDQIPRLSFCPLPKQFDITCDEKRKSRGQSTSSSRLVERRKTLYRNRIRAQSSQRQQAELLDRNLCITKSTPVLLQRTVKVIMAVIKPSEHVNLLRSLVNVNDMKTKLDFPAAETWITLSYYYTLCYFYFGSTCLPHSCGVSALHVPRYHLSIKQCDLYSDVSRWRGGVSNLNKF